MSGSEGSAPRSPVCPTSDQNTSTYTLGSSLGSEYLILVGAVWSDTLSIAAMKFFLAIVLSVLVLVLAVLQGALFDGLAPSSKFIRWSALVFWCLLTLGHFALLLFISARPQLVRPRNMALWNLSFVFCLFGVFGGYVHVVGG